MVGKHDVSSSPRFRMPWAGFRSQVFDTERATWVRRRYLELVGIEEGRAAQELASVDEAVLQEAAYQVLLEWPRSSPGTMPSSRWWTEN